MSAGVLLVTGGSRGIGAAIVAQAAREGYAIAFSYREDDAAAARVLADAEAAGATALAVRADVADEAGVARFFRDAEAALGDCTALVNNVGITGGIGPFAGMPTAVLRQVLEVNVLGTMLCAREAVTRWQARGTPGALVNISSIAATLGSAGEYVHYAASKAAVDTFTLGLARELAATGVRVNAVAPGTTMTEIHARGGDPGRPARVAGRIPMGRVAEPAEIAEAVLWLLSAKASYVTGEVLRVGGGL